MKTYRDLQEEDEAATCFIVKTLSEKKEGLSLREICDTPPRSDIVCKTAVLRNCWGLLQKGNLHMLEDGRFVIND